jgi:hypothetical protein
VRGVRCGRYDESSKYNSYWFENLRNTGVAAGSSMFSSTRNPLVPSSFTSTVSPAKPFRDVAFGDFDMGERCSLR